jgi:hypothetical protein
MLSRKTFLAATLIAWEWAALAPAVPQLTVGQLDGLHRLIKPQADESKWARIPWLTNLQEARKRSAAQDKPLLLWRSGGGDVLGRT